jgi:hypothetical protein
MGALEENYQDFCPNYVQEFCLSMRHICMVRERGNLADSPMGALEQNYKDLLLIQLRPRILPLYAASVWWERGDLPDSPMGALEENYQDLLLFQLRPRIRPLYAAHLYGGERGDLPDSPMGALGHWPGIYIYSTPLQYHLGRVLIKYCRKHNVCIIPGKEVRGGGGGGGRGILWENHRLSRERVIIPMRSFSCPETEYKLS